jgi:hypothetical protein
MNQRVELAAASDRLRHKVGGHNAGRIGLAPQQLKNA